MREYIFTEHEKAILKKYLEEDIKEAGLRTLMTRIRKNYGTLNADFKLIEKALSI